MEDRVSEVETLQQTLGVRWHEIDRARATADAIRSKLEEGLARYTTEDTSIVVFGSLARGEATAGSDIDWTLLVDGQSYPEHEEVASEIADWIERQEWKGPGREATFGGLTFSHDLINHIGGSEDTNRNLTQRILLLLESAPLGRPDAYVRVLRGLLERYIYEDFGWLHSSNPEQVPRFLQNDIARYWRTVAVDFAYKRRQRAGKGWALRTIKLRLSRKLTYAAGLCACFRCAYLEAGHPGLADLPVDARAEIVMAELEALLRKTPLEIVADVFLRFPELAPAADAVFGSYDRFLALLNDVSQRKHLDSLRQEDTVTDPVFKDARELGHRFQEGLNAIFLREDGKVYSGLTRIYGVF